MVEKYNKLARENEALRSENSRLTSELDRLNEQLDWLKRQVFGRKSERFVDTPAGTDLLPGLVFPQEEQPAVSRIEVPTHVRKKTRRKGSCTVDIPDTLERVERVIDVPPEERVLPDGTEMVCIGVDRSEKLAYRGGEYYMLVTVRPKYAAPAEPRLGVVQENMPGSLIEGSKFDSSFMAHIVEEKFAFHLPLYRIEEKLAARGIRVTRQVLSQLLRSCGERILPLFSLMAAEVFRQGYLFTDDTPVKMQAKGKCREARVWVYVGARPNAPPFHIYQFSDDRSHRHPLDFLADFSGVIHADAFGAYEKLDADPASNIRWSACWAHARRKFEEAGESELRTWVLRQMRYLFLYERVAWGRKESERLQIRAERELPLVDGILRRLRQEVSSGGILPKSKMAAAMGYMMGREHNFRLYLADPNLRMENNTAERALRKLTIGRKNWLFVGSPRAGESMAALLSLVQTCRAMDIHPQSYLQDIFERLLDHPARRLEELLPDRWKAAQQNAASERWTSGSGQSIPS